MTVDSDHGNALSVSQASLCIYAGSQIFIPECICNTQSVKMFIFKLNVTTN